MNVLKRISDILVLITCIISGFVIYGCAAQRSVPQEPLLSTNEKITEQSIAGKHLREFNSWELDDPDKAEEIEAAIREVQEDPESSLVDKVLARAWTLQREGKIAEAIEKWRAVANMAEEIDNVFAARLFFIRWSSAIGK